MAARVGEEAVTAMEIRLFGALDVLIGGHPLPRLHSRKGRYLLALLTLRPNREVERSWLAGTLWPESSESQALFNLRQCLSNLRHALGEEAQRLQAPTPHTLCLDLTGATADVLTFDAAMAQGDAASLQEAISLYRGPLLEDCSEEWVLPEREAREQAYLKALETLAERAQEQQNYREAARLLRQAVITDPLREGAQRSLMQALASDGDLAAAVQTYRELREYLHRDLNAEPDPETTALFQTIRQEAPDRARTRVLERRNTRTPEPLTPRLPVQFTRFFGREDEIARLQALLSPLHPSIPSSRLVTLTGPGGSGKTRLAIETAESLKEGLEGAIWFTPLASLNDASLIPNAIVDALGLPRAPNQEPIEQAVGFLNGMSGPTLLILDNFEHLLEHGTPIVRTLLERVPLLTVLVTSRQPLNLEGEREFPVAPLPVPGPSVQELPPLEHLVQCPSVALLVDRAQARRPGFQVTAGNAEAVSELCRRLEGIPLAIELAAGWARTQTPQQMLSQMEHRFHFLVSSRTDLSPRHFSLHAALEWSYRLLTSELQRFFYRLSVFRGGWTVEAAEAVCEEPGAQEYLAQLVERSLVLAEEQEEVMRFRMLETLREFGKEQMSPEEYGATRNKHLAYFLVWAEETEPKLRGAEQAEWLERIEAEHDNFRAALTWGLEQEPGSALRLCGALGRFWEVRGHLSGGREWLRQALSHPRAQSRTKERANALKVAGWLTKGQSDYFAARALYEESIAIWREIGDRRGISACLNNLGNVATEQGDYYAARALYEESLAIQREIGDRSGIIGPLQNLGVVVSRQGDYAVARAYHEESLAILRELGDMSGIARALNNLGNVAFEQGDYVSSRAFGEECLAIYRELGDRRGVALLLNGLGSVATDQGDYTAARALYEESLAIQREIGDRWGIAGSLHNLGIVTYEQGDHAAAQEFYQEALVINREIGSRAEGSKNLLNLGLLAFDQGDYASARRYFQESLVIKQEILDPRGIASSLERFAHLAAMESTAAIPRAARLWGAAERLREEIGVPLPPFERKKVARAVEVAREAIEEEAFAVAWAEGRAMTLEQAVELATTLETD